MSQPNKNIKSKNLIPNDKKARQPNKQNDELKWFIEKRKRAYERIGASGLAKTSFELGVLFVGELHDAVADDSRNDAAYGSEGYEEWLRLPRPPHQPPPRRTLLPQ